MVSPTSTSSTSQGNKSTSSSSSSSPVNSLVSSDVEAKLISYYTQQLEVAKKARIARGLTTASDEEAKWTKKLAAQVKSSQHAAERTAVCKQGQNANTSSKSSNNNASSKI